MGGDHDARAIAFAELTMFARAVIAAAAPAPAAPAPAVVPVAYDAGGGITIHRTRQEPEAWAVRRDLDSLALDGTWDHEPAPSDRTQEWLARHRFASAEAAAHNAWVTKDAPRPIAAAALRAAVNFSEHLNDSQHGKVAVVRVADLEAWATELEGSNA